MTNATGGVPPHPSGPVPVPVEVPAAPLREARGWRYSWYRLKGSPLTLFGIALIALYVLVAAAAPILAPVPEGQRSPYDVRAEFGETLLEPGSALCSEGCPLGTSELGVDIYYGVVWGARISIAMGVGVTLAGALIGLVVGLLAGWYGGWFDDVVMRFTDIFLALPLLVLAIAVVTALGRGLENIALALIIVWWPPYTRLVRGQVLALRESQFVEAARAGGLPEPYILVRHVLPNAINPIIVQSTLDIGSVVLTAAALAFLGFAGTSSLLPEWGRLVALGQNYMATGQWWTVVFPGLAIFGFVLGFNLFGDGLRDLLESPGEAMSDDVLLEIRDLHLVFPTYVGDVKALDGVDLTIRRDETLGLVGESGCGKSVTAMSVMRLMPSARYPKGQVLFHAEGATRDLLKLREREMEDVRGNDVSMIFQEPMTSLNPVMRVADQISEAVLRHQDLGLEPVTKFERALEDRRWLVLPKLRERHRRARAIAVDMLKKIGISDPDATADRYPHELSGGMRQRVMIAMALACRPHLLIADEPTTALDVTIQAQIMSLMRDLKREEKASILLITHHLGLVAELCDRVAVMYAGQVVETASTRAIFHKPAHPYTVGLLKSIPSLTGARGELPVIPGHVPDLIAPPGGCRFHPRCPWAQEICKSQKPPMLPVDGDPEHRVACHLYDGVQTVPAELRDAGVKRKEALAG